jgi:peptide/nickel transport system substrate-binding protein
MGIDDNNQTQAHERLNLTRRDLLKHTALAGAGVALAAAPIARSAAAQSATPVAGGTINVGVAAEIKVLDPQVTTLAAYHSTIRFTIFETLIEVDDNGQYVSNLADSWKFAADGLSLTANLAKGVQFHNGKAFTAQDVIFTVNRLKDPKLASDWAPQVANVKSVEAPDDSTIVFHFTAPTPAFLENLLNIQILTAQDIDKIGSHPVGTGPFEFVEWVLNDHITLKKFAGYRQSGLPYLDQIVFRPILDPDTRLTNLQAGSVDLVEQPAPKDAGRIKSDSKLTLLVTAPTSKYDNIQINCLNNLMTDKRVRQAMSFAFDRATYVSDILYGFGKPAVGPFADISWAYDAATVEPYLKFDLNKASQLLSDAGHKGLSGVEILSPKGYDELKSAAVLLQANLATIGVTATVSELEIAGWIDRIATKPDYVMTTDTYGYGDSDPATVLSRNNFAPDTNIHQFRDAQYKTLVEQGATTPDQAARKVIYTQIQQLLMDQMPGFLLARRSDLYAMQNKVHGYNPGPFIRHHYTKVWIG